MKNISEFVSQVKAEFVKIEWPSFDEWIGSTAVTLILVVFFALFLGAVDRGIGYLAQLVFTYGL